MLFTCSWFLYSLCCAPQCEGAVNIPLSRSPQVSLTGLSPPRPRPQAEWPPWALVPPWASARVHVLGFLPGELCLDSLQGQASLEIIASLPLMCASWGAGVTQLRGFTALVSVPPPWQAYVIISVNQRLTGPIFACLARLMVNEEQESYRSTGKDCVTS